MLYSYPASALADNWLHWCLVLVLLRVHEDVDAGIRVTKWPAIIPDAYRAAIAGESTLML